MAYARFGWGHSDVYVFWCVDGCFTCCMCIRDADPHTPDAEVMADHLRWHIEQGDNVPDHVIPAILGDATPDSNRDHW
ncbi:hypothetical protein [Phytoactinopolyspora endophytica]|uniref:hypothetical protein n=1 Tax=Phytoactinopolyspora endophytica TaxID=1642495 RepID=UPI00101C33F7|nr:hypothetical protein [Phytoactinopolyspora endophytica]